MRIVLLSLLVLLTACGCGGGDSPQSTAAVQTRQVLIEAYGDSTVTGCTAQAGAPATPDCPVAGFVVSPSNGPATLQALLRQQFGGGVTVANMGHAGTTLADLLKGADGTPWAYRMAHSSAQVVTLKYGINDAYTTTPEAFAGQLAEAVSIARAAGKVLILETSNPINNDHGAALAALVSAELAVAASLHVPVVNSFERFSALPGWPDYLSDGIHPTDAGYQVLGRNSFDALAPVVAGL